MHGTRMVDEGFYAFFKTHRILQQKNVLNLNIYKL
jgi:hypothetical protein